MSQSESFILDGIPERVDKPISSGRKKRNIALIAGCAIILTVLLAGIAIGIHPPHDPYATGGTPYAPPSSEHWLGTDNLGRDSFVRIMLAARTGVLISAATCLLAGLFGATIGLTSGYFGGWWDAIVMRIIDGALAIPGILTALIIRVILGAGTWQLILAMAVIYTPMMARVMRAPALQLRSREYVNAAKVAGAHPMRIIYGHVLLNALGPLLVQGASIASSAVALEAGLSYLGQGVQPPEPSAGRMISEYQIYMQTDPLLVLAPTAVIVVLSFGWNLIADGIQSHVLADDGMR